MIKRKKTFYTGLGMLVSFIIVLIIFFMPVFSGMNGLDYLDNLYNSISKGSAYYIPKAKTEADKYKGNSVDLALEMSSEKLAQVAEHLLNKGGAISSVSGSKVNVSGDLGRILENCLEDADYMYNNDGNSVSGKYGKNEMEILYTWWKTLNAMSKGLSGQKKFKEAKIVSLVQKKAVETAYNYYKIEPQQISQGIWIVILSLVFYVVYTVWYGFSFMFLFEGLGLRIEH